MMESPSSTVKSDPNTVKETLLLSIEALLVFNGNANVKGMVLSQMLVRGRFMAYCAYTQKHTGKYRHPLGKHL